jgi:hypothetical protein
MALGKTGYPHKESNWILKPHTQKSTQNGLKT